MTINLSPLVSSSQGAKSRFCEPLYNNNSVIMRRGIFRLFIDYDRLKEGPFAFDLAEPGYGAAMKRALREMERDLGNRIDAEKFGQMHDACVKGVFVWKERKKIPFVLGYYCGNEQTGSMKYGFIPNEGGFSISKEAKEEWRSHQLITQDIEEIENYLSYYLDTGAQGYVYTTYMDLLTSFEEGKRKVNQLFNAYYEAIGVAQSQDDQLAAIVNLCRALEIYHVFKDGNQRTIAVVLLNRLVRENGIAHGVIVKEPRMFDGYFSTKEMVERIKQGIEVFYEQFPTLADSR